jgi:CO dehydrogenase nickel-insertion accessory protein CooC1
MNTLEPDHGMKPLAGQRIGIFGRGGSGKSTCTVFLAKALAETGYTVCVLDADSTNEGLALALGADYVPQSLLDFKAGIEDASRGVVTSLDWVVLVIDPSYAGVQAAATMKTLLEQLHHGALPATRHLQSPEMIRLLEASYRGARTKGAVYVLNKVADAEIEYQLWQRLLGAGLHATAVIRDDPQLRAAWLEGSPLRSVPALAEAAKLVRALEEGRGAFVEDGPAKNALATFQ